MTRDEVRTRLLEHGYTPTPVSGKRAVANGWEAKLETNCDEIRLWSAFYPNAFNTGILTRYAPAIDIDITFQPAAEAIEQLAREEFEERGFFMVRIGQAPKRAIPLRTDEPFDKITAAFTAPDGSAPKIEVLGDGQQIVVDGIHPDTQRPYHWHGGDPCRIPRDDLPYVRRDDIVAFLEKATKLLADEYGFKPEGAKVKAKPNGYARSRGCADGERAPTDWAELTTNIIAGRDLHDSTVRLAASYLAGGMTEAAADPLARRPTLASQAPHDARWKARLDDIGRAVRTARQKYSNYRENTAPRPGPAEIEKIMNTHFEPIAWVVPGIVVEGLTLLAAKPKVGKSWLTMHAAHAVSTGGFTLGDIHCIEGDVLLCALEDSPRRIKSRMLKMFGHDVKVSQRLKVLCEMPRLVEGGLDVIKDWIAQADRPRLVIIDTLAMVRISAKRTDTAFQADYDAVKDLRTLAAEHHVAIILVHHLRKADSDDPFDTVNATLGLTAAVDGILIIKRDANKNHTMYGRGRDLAELEKALLFNRDTCTWTIIGDAGEVRRTADRNAIIAALKESQAEMSTQEIAAGTGLKASKL